MATTETVDVPATEGFRVYIGNLSFNSTEEQVKDHLRTAGGSITSVNLPKKFGGRRPGGFGFAEFEREEDAKNVIEKLTGSELDGRKIRLDPARNAEETEKHRAERNEKRDAGRAARDAANAEKKAARAAETVNAGETTAVDGEVVGDGEKKKKKPNKKRAPRRRQPGEEGEEGTAAEGVEGAAADTSADVGEAAEKPKRKPKAKKPKDARIDAVEGEAAEGAEVIEKPKKERKPRAPRQKRSEPTGEVSKTSIFVANLPFDVDDTALSAIFTNLSINVKSAKVATRKRYSKNKEEKPVRTSRGFGFVDVEDPAQQKEAVEKVEGTLIGDRTITARAANEMREIEREVEELKEEAAEHDTKAGGEAAAPAASA